MHMYLQQEGCYDALYSQHPIPVFHHSREELCQRVDHREVDRAQRAWETIMEKLSVPHMIEHFAILGSPSQAWEYLVQFNSVSPLTEKTKLEQEWYGLKMNSGETPTEYLGRATLILGRRRQYGGIDISDSEANRHIARRLSSDYSWSKSKLLDMPTLDSATLERTIKNTCDEMTLSDSLTSPPIIHQHSGALADFTDISLNR